MLNKKRVLSATVASVAGLLIASSASAAGAYIGGQLGYGMTHQPGFTNSDVSSLTALGIGFSRSNHPNGLAGRVFGGYDITPNLAAELGFTKFSNATAKINIPALAFTANETVKTYAVDLVGKATLPLQNGFSVYGKGGVAYVHGTGNANVTMTGATATKATESEHKYMPTFGAGLGYEINQNLTADVSWTRFQKTGNTEFLKSQDFFGVGLAYHFA